ncbi:HEAT repeat domain-containing protein [Labilithrix luteola]|uniref:HEAT repeat domain-containing protein n=1 Tax=Labilithrix luteola TaxID=1391654 RepID=UPI0011BA955B|nr:HEAT repeat domain-containing protein [Labilithrix luteola]
MSPSARRYSFRLEQSGGAGVVAEPVAKACSAEHGSPNLWEDAIEALIGLVDNGKYVPSDADMALMANKANSETAEATAAIRILGAIGDRFDGRRARATEIIANRLTSRWPQIRLAAAEALWLITDPSALPAVRTAAACEDVPVVKKTLDHVSKILGGA